MKIITKCQYFHRMKMGRLCRDTVSFCSRQIKPWHSEMAITISTRHPFRCSWLTQEKDQCHQYQRESIDSACNFVCSNLNYCLKRSSLGPLSQPTALIKPTTMAVQNFPEYEQIVAPLPLVHWYTCHGHFLEAIDH